MIKVLLLNLLLSNSFFLFEKNNDTLEINNINKINLELLNRKIDSIINVAISLKAFPVVWSKRKVRNFKEFKLRLNLYKYFLDLENINYSPHEFK